MKIAAKTSLAAFLMIFSHIIKHRQGSSLSGRTFSPAAFSVLNTENLNIFRKGVFNGDNKNKDRIRGKSERRKLPKQHRHSILPLFLHSERKESL